MGKPMKRCAEYFYHDADMRNDIKIKALRRKYGLKGYAVWNYLLEILTDSDCFELEYSPLCNELLAADFDISAKELKDIVEYCKSLNLLQSSEDGKLIFSNAHKSRLQNVIDLKEKRSEAGKIGMQSRWGNNQRSKGVDNTVITTDNTVITTDNERNRTELNRKELNGKEPKKKNYPYQGIVDSWNALCQSLPKVAKLTDRRKQKIKARLEEFGVSQEQWLATTEQLFRRVQDSDFLTGRTDNRNGWTATFDWLFDNSSNWVKVTEGNYDNKGQRTAQDGAQSQRSQLGVGEYIDGAGRRTYGTGRATIPNDAAPRPTERHQWDAASQTWILM